ncbi:RluA family pseudouridine synthase [Floccifex sp.]|uniref:RluA family pseudouridine synthase n=1 Tax=Floccifex sp. TaxID=2815810 RepID=UPI002A748A69|nr:RluA family pseudouridine synthase [Floccifex sp.]MDD7281586.1 RluA family pseudouridine synthase [Erysipelotrichaceae bacterium]MDY2958169.1 RluA family pseudouridine synthase [Floccifex sp.]
MEKRIIKIDESLAKQRLDKGVASALDESRKYVKDLIDGKHIFVNGKNEKASYTLCENDEVVVEIQELESTEVLPEDIPLDIVYEDQDVIVINKPKGMVVHPAPGHYSGTLVNALLYHCKDLSGINGVMRPGIVHRIDKDTSGLLVVCKNDFAHRSISEQLQDKTCHRQYVCIVHHPFSHEYGTIHAPIGRCEKDRKKMEVTAKNSKDAITHFTVLKNFKDYAYVQCQLETGRTHQIRVHMQYIGHPIAGDPTYGYRKTIETNGQLLHANKLEFKHPRTNELMTFEIGLEPEFARVLKELEENE